MIVVPISGDAIKTKHGLMGRVLGYNNMDEKGPSVLVDGEPNFSVALKDLEELNGLKVKVLKSGPGKDVLDIAGKPKRQLQLPQPGDLVKVETEDGTTAKYTLKKLSLGVKNNLAKGLILSLVGEDGSTLDIGLDDIVDLPGSVFNRKRFLNYYSDYFNGS